MARIYVGNLPMDMRDKDVEDIFYKYGRIRDVDLKTPLRPPAFAFVAFENLRDAEDAVRGRDGYEYEGSRLRVELARSGRGDPRGPSGFGGGGGFRGPPPNARTSEHRVIITGLPPSASWQDLKDHMRKAGDVIYADVDHRGGGIVHYSSRGDMDYALRKLDESEFRNPFDRSHIRVLPPRGASRRDSRSPRRRNRYSSSRSRSRSPDRRRRSRSYSRSTRSSSRSRSPKDVPDKRTSNNGSVSPDRMDASTGRNGDHDNDAKDSSPYDEK